MPDEDAVSKKKAHLKVAAIFFAFWLFIIYVIVQNIRDLGRLPGFMEVIGKGDYSDLILVALSIYLLAMAFRSLFFYLSIKRDDS